MTKNIDNNEIETLEGVYTQTTETEHQEENYSQPNKPKKNFLKPLIIGALAVAVTGGAGSYAYNKYEQGKRAKVQEAYSKIKMNVDNQSQSNQSTNPQNNEFTQQNNSNNNASVSNTNNTQQATYNVQQNSTSNIKSQEEVQRIVAQAISTPKGDIYFKKIRTEYEDDYAYQNNGALLFIYDIEVRANGLEYDIEIDAVTGKVLKVKIDS